MEQLKLNTSWDQVKEKIKETNIDLTDEDLDYTPGQEDQLYERLSKKLNKSKDEVRQWVESVASNKGKAG